MQKVDFFRNKKFLIVHGTADGNIETVLLFCMRLFEYEYDATRYEDLYGRLQNDE